MSKGTTLWENPNPTAAFAAQTITLNKAAGDFKYIEIRFRGITNDAYPQEF